MDVRINQIEALIKKASEAEKSEDAMRFSQAATNAANALHLIESMKQYSNEQRQSSRFDNPPLS